MVQSRICGIALASGLSDGLEHFTITLPATSNEVEVNLFKIGVLCFSECAGISPMTFEEKHVMNASTMTTRDFMRKASEMKSF